MEQMESYIKKARYNYKSEKKVYPAIDEFWISKCWEGDEFQEYYSEFSDEENKLFLEQNGLFSETLEDILYYNYHIFWCSVIFNQTLKDILKNFFLKHVRWYDLRFLNEKQMKLYTIICEQILQIYKRLFRFQESEVSGQIYTKMQKSKFPD